MSARENWWVYMLASGQHGTLYVGVTNDLVRRVWEHREGLVDGFTKKYTVKRLVWYEAHSNPGAAIQREKRLKRWRRDWKIRLIEEENLLWSDLYESITK
jgi:putative endonuclease